MTILCRPLTAAHSNRDLCVHVVSGNDRGVGRPDDTTRPEGWGAPANTASEHARVTGRLDRADGSTSGVC